MEMTAGIARMTMAATIVPVNIHPIQMIRPVAATIMDIAQVLMISH